MLSRKTCYRQYITVIFVVNVEGRRPDIVKIYRPDGKCNIAGEKVKAARERAGLSQEQLAAKIQLAGLNLGQKAISRIELGERIVADYELDFLAGALGVSIYYLLGKE